MFKGVEKRRSNYFLSSDISISKERVKEIVEYAAKHTPSCFNSQTGRAVILFDNHHKQLWEMIVPTLEKKLPSQAFEPINKKLQGFVGGFATILFFEDMNKVKSLEAEHPALKHNFVPWSNQSSGIFQYIVWTALADESVGANIQHFNELIEDEVDAMFTIEKGWKLISQMTIGKIIAPPKEKTFLPIADRVKVFEG